MAVVDAIAALFVPNSVLLRALSAGCAVNNVRTVENTIVPLLSMSVGETLDAGLQLLHQLYMRPQLATCRSVQLITALHAIADECPDKSLSTDLNTYIMQLHTVIIYDAMAKIVVPVEPTCTLLQLIGKSSDVARGNKGFLVLEGKYKDRLFFVHSIQEDAIVCTSARGIRHRIGKHRIVQAV